MNDMLQHQEYLTEEIRRHQQESQRWAQAGMLGRIADGVRDQSREHPARTRILGVATPMAVALGLLAIII